MNSDIRKSGNMNNIGERYKDKLTEYRDWMDGINGFRGETKDRMMDLNVRMNELELSLEENIQKIRNYIESAKKKS